MDQSTWRPDHYTIIVENAEGANFHREVWVLRLEVRPLNTGTALNGEYDMLNYILRFRVTHNNDGYHGRADRRELFSPSLEGAGPGDSSHRLPGEDIDCYA